MEMLNANHRRKSKFDSLVLLLMIFLLGSTSGNNFELTDGVNYEESFHVAKKNADETQPGEHTVAGNQPQAGILATLSSTEQDGDQDADIFVAEIFPDQPGGLEQIFKPLARYKKAILGLDAQIEPSDMKEPYEGDDSEFVVPVLATKNFGENIPESAPLPDFTNDEISNGDDRLRNFEKDSRNLQDNKIEGQKLSGYNSYREASKDSGSLRNEKDFKGLSSYKNPEDSGSHENKSEQEKHGLKAGLASYEDYKGHRGVQFEKGVNEGAFIKENTHQLKSSAEMYTRGDNNLQGNQEAEHSKKTDAEQDEVNKKEAYRGNSVGYEGSGSGEGSADGQEESGSGSIEGQAKLNSKDDNKDSTDQSKVRNLEPRNWGSTKDEVEVIKIGEHAAKQENLTLVSEEDKKFQGSEKSADELGKEAEESKGRIIENRNNLPANLTSKKQISETNEIKRLDTGKEGRTESETNKDKDITGHQDSFDTNIGNKNNQTTFGSNTQLTSESKRITLGTSEQVSTYGQVINNGHTLHEKLQINRYMGSGQENGVNKEIQQKRNATGDSEADKSRNELKDKHQDMGVDDDGSNIGEETREIITSSVIENGLRNGVIKNMKPHQKNSSTGEPQGNEAGKGRDELYDSQEGEETKNKDANGRQETKDETASSLRTEVGPKSNKVKKMQNENNARDETKEREADEDRNELHGMQRDGELRDEEEDTAAKTGRKIVDIFVDNALQSNKDRETSQQLETNEKSQNDTNNASKSDTSTSEAREELQPIETNAINTTEDNSQDVKNSNSLVTKGLQSKGVNNDEEMTEATKAKNAEINEGINDTRKQAGIASDREVITNGLNKVSKQMNNEDRTAKAQGDKAITVKNIEIELGNPNKKGEETNNEEGAPKMRSNETNKNTVANDSMVQKSQENGVTSREMSHEIGEARRVGKISEDNDSENTYGKAGADSKSLEKGIISDDGNIKENQPDLGLQSNSGSLKAGFQNKEHMNEEHSTQNHLSTSQSLNDVQTSRDEDKGISDDVGNKDRFQKRKGAHNQSDGPKAAEDKKVVLEQMSKESKENVQERKENAQERKENAQGHIGNEHERKENAQERKENEQERKGNAQEHKENAQEHKENAQERKENVQEHKENVQEHKENAQERKENVQEHKENAQEHKENAQEHKENAQERKENEHEGLVNVSKDDLLKTRLSSEEAARKLFLSIVHGNNTDEKEKDARMEERTDQPANTDHGNSSSVEKSNYVTMIDKTEDGQFSTATEKSPDGADGKQRESSAEQEVSGIKEAMNVAQEDNSGDAENHDENVGRSPKQGNEEQGMFIGNKGRLATQPDSNENSITSGNFTSLNNEVTPKTVAQQNENLGLVSQQGNEDKGKLNANEAHSSNEKDVTQANMTSFSKEETPTSEQSSANESPVDMMELNSTNMAGVKTTMKAVSNYSVVNETKQPARQINNPFDKVTEQLFGAKLQDDMDESEAENSQSHDKIEVGNQTRNGDNLKAWNDNTAGQKEVKHSAKVEGQKEQSTVRQNSKTKNASKMKQKPKPSQQMKERKDSKDRHQAKEQRGQEERQKTEVRLQNKEWQWFKIKQQLKPKQSRRKHRSRKRKKSKKIHGKNLDFSTILMSQKARELYMNLIHDTSQALMTKKRHKTARRRHFQTHSKLSPFMNAQHLRASHIPLENSITMQYFKSKAGKVGNAAAGAIEPVKGVHELAGKLLSTMMENDQKLMKQTALRPMDGKMDAARKHYVAEKLDTPSSLIGKLAELKVDVNLDKKGKEVPAPHNENIEDASLKEATLENENPGKTVMQKQKGAGLGNNVDLDKLDGSKQEYEYKVLDAKIEGELAKSEDETSKGEDIGVLALKQRNASAANLTQPVAKAKPSIGNLSVYNTEESLGSEARDYQNEANDDMNEKMYLKQKDAKQVGDFEVRKNESNVVLGRKLKDREEGMLRKNEEGMLRLEHGKNLTVSWHRHPSLYFDGNSSLWKHHDVVSMDIEPLVDVFYKVNHENLVDLVEHPELVRKEQKLRVKGMLQGNQKISQRKDGAKKKKEGYNSKHGMMPLSKKLKSKQITRLQQWIHRMQLLSKQRVITTQSKQGTDSKQLEESKQRTLSEPWAQLKQRPLQSQKMLSEPWKQRKYDEERDDGITYHRRKQMKIKGRGRDRKNHKVDREKGRTHEERKMSHANKERKMGHAESERQMAGEQNYLQTGHGDEEHEMNHADKDHNVDHAKNERQMGREKNNREMGYPKKERKMGHVKEESKMIHAKDGSKMSHQGQGNKMSHEASEHKMQQADSEHAIGHAEKQRKIGSQENKHAAGNFEKQEHKVKAKNKKMFHHHYRHKHKKPVQGTAKFGISGSEQSASPPQEPKFKNNMPANVKYFLIENAAKRGALCIDGSTPGYYLRRGFGTGEKNWIIHLHGGAWCYDAQSCYRRSFSILGSTNHWSAENITNFFQGFLSDKQEINPYFHNWNVVVQTYCDGGLFSGKRKEALEINGRKLYFRGRPILKAMVESLKRRNLESATDIILSGTSAGGLAVLLQGDYLKHRLPKTATVRGLVDAGFFLDSPSEDGSNVVENQFKGLFDIHQPKLRMKCENGKDNSTKYQCLFPQQTILHTKLPVYFVNALYDHWQLSELQRLHCVYNNDNCIPEQRDRILNFRNVMYDHLLDALGHMKHAGLFADSCIGHGQVIVDYTWTRIRVNNKTINDAFHDWFNDRSGEKRHINTDCRYPCNGSCPRAMVRSCIKNFKGASNKYRTKRSAELC